MYRILGYEDPAKKENFIVFDNSVDCYVNSAKLKLKADDVDDLELTVGEGNPLFNSVQPFRTHVEVYEDDTLIFRGRALKPVRSMDTKGLFTREYIFESIDSYLIDSIQRFNIAVGIKVKDYLQYLLDVHNKQVDSYKKITLKTCDVDDKTGDEYRQIDYPTTREAINSQLLEVSGGHIAINYSDKGITLNYTKKIGKEHDNSPIQLTSNLRSVKYTVDPTNLVTRLIPLGQSQKSEKIALGDDQTSTTEIEKIETTGATKAINGDWGPAIKHAAQLMNVTLQGNDLQNIKNMIQGESGGSETVVNNWDDNAKKGIPSAGLLQFIEPTFRTYQCSPYTTWKRGFDQLIALFNISTWRSEVQSWQIYRAWSPNGARRYSSVPNTSTKTQAINKTSNPWGWPFPSVGEGKFTGGQLFGVHAGGEFRTNGFHNGLDFGNVDHPGSSIHAIHGGTVTRIAWANGLKWYVLFHSSDGYNIVYQEAFSSKSNITVKVGQTVKTGAVIGTRTTDHLHVGVTKAGFDQALSKSFINDGTWLDPQKLIKEGGSADDKNSKKTETSYSVSGDSKMPRYDISSVNGGKDYIDIPELQKEFGIIEKTKIWDSITDPKKLKETADKWLKNNNNTILTQISVDAIELPKDTYKVNDSYHIINPYVLTDQLWKVTSKEIDLLKPYDVKLTFGDKQQKFTSYQIQRKRELKSTIDHLQRKLATQGQQLGEVTNLSNNLSNSLDSTNSQVNDNTIQNSMASDYATGNFNKWKEENYDRLKEDYDNLKNNYDDFYSQYLAFQKDYESLKQQVNSKDTEDGDK